MLPLLGDSVSVAKRFMPISDPQNAPTPHKERNQAMGEETFIERTHEELWTVCKELPSDFEPWGKRSRERGGPDCSCGCKWYHVLFGEARFDWGVCVNPLSPRAGLLTFEHQGCGYF